MGERKLVQGRVVEIIDLDHLDEGYDPDRELYVIEVKTGIDNIYEVRDFGMISPDANGPITAFRRDGLIGANRLLKKIGMPFPVGVEEFNGGPSVQHNITPRSTKKKNYYRKKSKPQNT